MPLSIRGTEFRVDSIINTCAIVLTLILCSIALARVARGSLALAVAQANAINRNLSVTHTREETILASVVAVLNSQQQTEKMESQNAKELEYLQSQLKELQEKERQTTRWH